MEKALQESQERLAGIIASAMDAIITVDEQQHIILFNAAAEEMFGYQAGDVLGRPVDILLPERFRMRHRDHIRRFGKTGTTSRAMGRLGRLYGRRSNGVEFPIEASISQVKATDGQIFTVILRDLTEQVENEEKLIESEQRLRAAFEQAAIGIAHLSPDGRYLRVNRKLCEITGYTHEELLGRSFQEITYPDDLDKDLELESDVLAGRIANYSIEKRYIRKDGSLIWVTLTVSLVRGINDEPRYLIKLIEDITARKQTEAALQARTDEIKTMTQQLWQTAKLATMGELAASVAHELNNPLAILTLRIESLLSNLPETDPKRGEMLVMEQEVDRMASLVANLLQFSRSGQRQISSLDVREEIEKTLELIHTYLVHRRIDVRREYPQELPLLHADRQQLRQLFLNLFTNAADAMPEGGSLTLRIKPTGNGHILIEVADTGIGIRPEDVGKIMEPFYTTKPGGKGTGLGLSICRRIVEEHKGSLRISSPGPGQGAVVEVSLPALNGSKPVVLED